MKEIVFTPRLTAENIVPSAGDVIISIYTPNGSPAVLQQGWADVLLLSFHDSDVSDVDVELFSDHHAKQIFEFVEKHKDVERLVVHCDMGHSRSAAIAIYLSEKHACACFKINRRVDWQSWPNYNKHIYRTLMLFDGC